MEFEPTEQTQDHPELTREAFYEMWGEKVDIGEEIFVQMWSDSERLMPDLPYHNFTHVRKTLFAAMHICDKREARDPTFIYNRRVLTGAILFHDTLFGIDFEAAGYESMEAASAALFAQYAPTYGYRSEESALGQRYILATKAGEPRLDENEEAIFEADTDNTHRDYDKEFKPNFVLLLEEDRIRKGLEHLYPTFVANTIKILCTYISDAHTDPEFRKQVASNLQRLARETAAEQGMSLLRYIHSLGSTTVNKVLGIRLPIHKD